MKTQDTWFLLLISAIWTELRLVGDIAGLGTVSHIKFCSGQLNAITLCLNSPCQIGIVVTRSKEGALLDIFLLFCKPVVNLISR